MRLAYVLPFAALSAAFVVPDQNVFMNDVQIESRRETKPPASLADKVPTHGELAGTVDAAIKKLTKATKNAIDHTFGCAEAAEEKAHQKAKQTADFAKSWLDSASADVEDHWNHDYQAQHGHHHHHHKPNQTLYQLIAGSKYTTKLAEYINEYDDIVSLLNGTTGNFTVFAPIDKAFEKIPEKAPKPSKDELKKILAYHISPDFYPAGKVLVTHTIPTFYDEVFLGGKAQRLSTNIGLKGLTVNFYSRIIAIDIFGTNGVIHGVSSILVPPPNAITAVQFFPEEFSTLELGLIKTGLIEPLNDTSTHVGGTLFAPSNFAFQKLGPKINAFLFSSYGLKYLKALLEYHVVANHTLYSDAYYVADEGVDAKNIPKGIFHVDLPTALKDRSLSVDVARFGRIISIKINAFATVIIEDGIVSDGVIQVVGSVLIPPKKLDGVDVMYNGEDLTEDDLKERLQPFVQNESDNEDFDWQEL